VPVTAVQAVDAPDQHWQVLLDEDGIIGPNGQPIQFQTRVQSSTNQKQLTTIFDTGFSFPQVPLCVNHTFLPPPSVRFLLASSSFRPFTNKIVCFI
jgi:hypothetical protein